MRQLLDAVEGKLQYSYFAEIKVQLCVEVLWSQLCQLWIEKPWGPGGIVDHWLLLL